MTFVRRFLRLFLQFVGLLTVLGVVLALAAISLLPRVLQVGDPVTRADYILPLAGEWHRFLRAAELYKSGYAPVVLVSNARDSEPSRFDTVQVDMGIDNPPRSVLRRRVLVHLGVPESALEPFGNGHISTVEEAEALRDHLAKRAADKPVRIILVTSAYHTRRARFIFSDVVPDVKFTVTSPPEGRLESQWWQDRTSAIRSVLESFKFAHYLLGGRFRATEPKPE